MRKMQYSFFAAFRIYCKTNIGLLLLYKVERLSPLKPNSSNVYTLPYRSNLPFLIYDIRTLWRSGLSARMSEIKNGRLGRYGAEHSRCNHTMKIGH